MSIHLVKSKGAYCFAFKRIINGRLIRATKLLPKAWSEAQCNAFDLKESARLYALHTGVLNSRPLIEQAVHLYLEEHVPSLKSAKMYELDFALLYPYYIGKTFDELPKVAAAINRTGLAPATKRRRIVFLCAACNYAYKVHSMGITRPSDRVSLPRVNNARDLHPSRAEVLRLARIAPKDVRAAILCAFYSGMRRSELLSATVENNTFIVRDTKNGKPRYVPVHRRIQIYSNRFPMTMSIDRLRRRWVEARDALGLSHYHWHDIRHSTASELINTGSDLYTVGLILGHTDIKSTQRYSHMLLDTLTAALRRI
jgi:integrase